MCNNDDKGPCGGNDMLSFSVKQVNYIEIESSFRTES